MSIFGVWTCPERECLYSCAFAVMFRQSIRRLVRIIVWSHVLLVHLCVFSCFSGIIHASTYFFQEKLMPVIQCPVACCTHLRACLNVLKEHVSLHRINARCIHMKHACKIIYAYTHKCDGQHFGFSCRPTTCTLNPTAEDPRVCMYVCEWTICPPQVFCVRKQHTVNCMCAHRFFVGLYHLQCSLHTIVIVMAANRF